MHIVVGRLAELDPQSEPARRAVERLNALISGGAAREEVVTAMAHVSGHAVRLTNEDGCVRVDPAGRWTAPTGRLDDAWPWLTVAPRSSLVLALEAPGACSVLAAVVLDRGAEALRTLESTAGDASDDTSARAFSTALSAADDTDRREALSRLGLDPRGRYRVLARRGSLAQIEILGDGPVPRAAHGARDKRPLGVGRVTVGVDLPESWQSARIALAFAADGGDRDPGPTVVVADELGVLAGLASGLDRQGVEFADLAALAAAEVAAPWALVTLDALARHTSLRLAAAALFVHHSTLQARVATLEDRLGWSVRDGQGRLRLDLALAVRRYLRHPPEDGSPIPGVPPVIGR